MPTTKSVYGEPFYRVLVDYAIQGTARITWELRPDFVEPGTYSFQVQSNLNFGDPATWVNMGAVVVNGYVQTDTTQKQYGSALRVGYRVKLTVTDGMNISTYYSNPAQVYGTLTLRQWLIARAIIRRARLKAKGLRCYQGFLMKRKTNGTKCLVCTDPVTGGCLNSDCSTCLGTGVTAGYWQAVENTMIDVTPDTEDTRTSDKGTMNEGAIVGTFIGLPPLHRNDLWIDQTSDQRYFVGKVTPVAEVSNVPIIVKAELRMAPYSDVIYNLTTAGS